MDIQTDIQWIISEVSKVKDPEFLNALKSMLHYRNRQVNQDWWDTISDGEKREIEEGLDQLDRGEFLSHEEVMKDARKWG